MKPKESQTIGEILITLAEDIEPFHTANGIAYADIQLTVMEKSVTFDRKSSLIGSVESSIRKLIKH